MNASSKGHEEIVKLLIAANANVNEVTNVSRLCKSYEFSMIVIIIRSL
jgi:ankyrin repeat protein